MKPMGIGDPACTQHPMESDVIVQEIVDDLESALEQFRLIVNDLGEKEAS